jgi:hypothetical protein
VTHPPHILTITETTTDGITEREYAIECPGITDRCRTYRPCQHPTCNRDDKDERTEKTAHGEQHIWLDEAVVDGWYIPTNDCYLVDHDNLPDAASGLPAGRHLVHAYFGDGFELELIAQPAGNLTAVTA